MKLRAKNLCLLLAVHVGLAGASAVSAAETTNTLPHAAYPYWAKPSALGKDHDTWQDAVGPDVGERTVDPARLPSRVDNSSRPQFPPIYKQRWGSCGQFASVASVLTYEMNVAFGTTADSDATRFPAYFSWNMMNQAGNNGSEAYHGWEVARHIGVPTMQTYGSNRPDTIGLWPDGYAVWRDAMNNRVAGYRFAPVLTVDQLNEARGWFFDRNQPDANSDVMGGVFTIDGRMGEMEKVTVTIPEGQYAAGQEIWTRWGPTGSGHNMTCVGYDDQVGYDLNGDGKITNDIDLNGDGEVTLADWERGAYIIANSWGEKWSGDGRIFLLYSAMVDSDWKRGNYLGRIEVKRHTPRMTARLKLACDDRTDLRLTLGIASKTDANEPELEVAPQAFNGWPVFGRSNAGHVPMAGPGNPAPIEIGVDLTSLYESLGKENKDQARVFLKLTRADGSKATGQLHEAAIRLYDPKGQFIREIPLQTGAGQFGESVLELSEVIEGLKQD